MTQLTEAGRSVVADHSARHNVSPETVTQLLIALDTGGGRQAQFNLPELGGMGQWAQGGMVMVGEMFNNGLKGRVDALCRDLAAALRANTIFAPAGTTGGWPADLGQPASQGSQNDMRYAWFPDTRRLAISENGQVTVYHTADLQISGFGQAQGQGQTLTFTSQYGTVPLSQLMIVGGEDQIATPDAAPAKPVVPAAPQSDPAVTDDQIFTRLERLADLHQRGVLSADEFSVKKAELLARL
ncbi:MAG: SHOCT domain-containing protein [bacterium]